MTLQRRSWLQLKSNHDWNLLRGLRLMAGDLTLWQTVVWLWQGCSLCHRQWSWSYWLYLICYSSLFTAMARSSRREPSSRPLPMTDVKPMMIIIYAWTLLSMVTRNVGGPHSAGTFWCLPNQNWDVSPQDWDSGLRWVLANSAMPSRQPLLPGMWSRSRRLGLETYPMSRLISDKIVNVSVWSRSRGSNVSVSAIKVSCTSLLVA